MIDVSMLEGLEIPDQREHSTPHLWARLAEWKLANPEGTLEECKRDLRGHLTENDIKELIAWQGSTETVAVEASRGHPGDDSH
jgi:hypothetical protein